MGGLVTTARGKPPDDRLGSRLLPMLTRGRAHNSRRAAGDRPQLPLWRRFGSARAFMGFTGLVPAAYSSGERTRRGAITKAGPAAARTALIEAACAPQLAASVAVFTAPSARFAKRSTPRFHSESAV